MNWLALLKEKEKGSTSNPTKPTKGGFVGFVGKHPSAFSSAAGDPLLSVGNDLDTPAQSEHDSMSKLLNARQALFFERGLSVKDAEAVALMLKHRDAECDERRLCFECSHMYGVADARRCGKWRQLGDIGPAVPADLVGVLRRCQFFQFKTEVSI